MIFDNEKFKELMYDIQRSPTDEDSHELIVNYSEANGLNDDNILCIKDVIMDGTGLREFTKNETYRIRKAFGGRFESLNDSGKYHGFGSDNGWFNEHFDFM